MDISNSQFNAASESGWTHYLDQSSFSEDYFQRRGGMEEEEEEEEDLSMVSDASSGPPHYHEEDDQPYCVNWYPSTSQCTKESKKKKKVKECSKTQQSSPLDDTASSPVLNIPKASHNANVMSYKKVSFSGNGAVENALDISQCFSATRIKRKPKFQKHFSFFEHPLRGKQASEEPGDPLSCTLCYYVCVPQQRLQGHKLTCVSQLLDIYLLISGRQVWLEVRKDGNGSGKCGPLFFVSTTRVQGFPKLAFAAIETAR
ncbi:hypothetical protein VNO77_11137 [Canavalia gladiata]|uniref:Uncharacterized protein n=1 Tax=Canavalia gladiata TaxID=3824 RepID=A0AAN9MEZ4_CANGL